MNSNYFSLYRDYSNSLTFSNVGELSCCWIVLIIISTFREIFSLWLCALFGILRGRAMTAAVLDLQWRIQGEGPGGLSPPPLILRPNWVPKDRKHFFGYWALPPLSRGLDDWASPLSRDLESALTYLHFWLSCYCRCRWILSVLNSSSSADYFGLLIHLCFKCCLSWFLRAKCPWGQERGKTAVFAG